MEELVEEIFIDTIIENLYFYQLFFPIVDDVPLSSEFVRS